MEYNYTTTVSHSAPAVQAEFYRRTFGLVGLSCAAFGAVLALILSSPLAATITKLIYGTGWIGILLVIAGFWAASAFANRLAFGGASKSTQLAGLGIYIVIEAIIFTPLLSLCFALFGVQEGLSTIVVPAAASTFLLAGGLILTAFLTKKDFSFLRSFVVIGTFVALAAIVVMAITGTAMTSWMIIAMIGLMAITILYQAWVVRTQLNSDQYVGAALIIFAGIATLFYYVILLFLQRRD